MKKVKTQLLPISKGITDMYLISLDELKILVNNLNLPTKLTVVKETKKLLDRKGDDNLINAASYLSNMSQLQAIIDRHDKDIAAIPIENDKKEDKSKDIYQKDVEQKGKDLADIMNESFRTIENLINDRKEELLKSFDKGKFIKGRTYTWKELPRYSNKLPNGNILFSDDTDDVQKGLDNLQKGIGIIARPYQIKDLNDYKNTDIFVIL